MSASICNNTLHNKFEHGEWIFPLEDHDKDCAWRMAKEYLDGLK